MEPIVTSVFTARCGCGRQRNFELDIRDPWRWLKIREQLEDAGWRHDARGFRTCPACSAGAPPPAIQEEPAS